MKTFLLNSVAMVLLAGCVMPYSHENLHASKIQIGGVTISLASEGAPSRGPFNGIYSGAFTKLPFSIRCTLTKREGSIQAVSLHSIEMSGLIIPLLSEDGGKFKVEINDRNGYGQGVSAACISKNMIQSNVIDAVISFSVHYADKSMLMRKRFRFEYSKKSGVGIMNPFLDIT